MLSNCISLVSDMQTFIEKLIFSLSILYSFYFGILQWLDNVKDFTK